MRYKDCEYSANDSCDIRNYSIEAVRRKQHMTDEYELLENYDFISHLEASGLLKQYRDASWEKEKTEEIHIDLDFMNVPSFYHEVESFDKLNKTLEEELLELDGKLTTPLSTQKIVRRTRRKRTWKVHFSMAIYSILAAAILLGGLVIFSGMLNPKDDAYAFDRVNKPVANTPDDIKTEPNAEAQGIKASDMKTKDKASMESDRESKAVDSALKNEIKKEKTQTKTQTKPQTKADKGAFQETAFIGNSLVVGLRQTCNVSGASFYACQSLDIRDAFDKKFVVDKQKKDRLTILQALSQKRFKRIYLMFGINELGWPYSEVFIQKYQELIKKIKALQPKAVIYVQSILPVTKSCENTKMVFSKKSVVERNKLLKKMSASMKVVYLNVYSSLCDEQGYLPESNSTDGIHLRKVGYTKWLDYLKKEKNKKN